jgi:hypothetical protein
MALADGRAAFKSVLLQLAANTDPDKDPSEAMDEFIDALEVYIKSADVSPVSLTPMTNGGGPVTGLGTLL